jgi:hypothetical protein
MKNIVVLLILLFTLFCSSQELEKSNESFQAPIPLELMVGNNYSLYQMTVSKQLTPGNKFGFFNLLSYEIDYVESTPDIYFIQSVFTYNINNNFNVGAGANLKSFESFNPIVWSSYSVFNDKIGFILQPSIELSKNGVAELFSLFEWHPVSQNKLSPYFRVQALFGRNNKHVFSYHYWRLGAQYNMFRFGAAINVQYIGENTISNTNLGGFVSVLIN